MTRNGQYPELPRRSVEAFGVRTSYIAHGSSENPAVVMLHGMSTSADSFREVIHELSDSFWLIAPDIPGFGFSAQTDPYTVPHLVEWLATFLEDVGLQKAHFVGHSFGGMLSSAFTVVYPESVNRLVLIAPAVLIASKMPRWISGAVPTMRLAEAGIALSRVWLERQIRVQFFDPARVHEDVWSRRRADYARARASAGAVHAVSMYDLRTHLAEIKPATAIIWGDEDPVLPSSGAADLSDIIPDSSTFLLPDCGHVPMLEHTGNVVRIIRGFLA